MVEDKILNEWYNSKEIPTIKFVEFVMNTALHYMQYYNLFDTVVLGKITQSTLEKRHNFNPDRGNVEAYFTTVIKSYLIQKKYNDRMDGYSNVTVS